MELAGARRDDCSCCAKRVFPYLDPSAGEQAVTLCGRNAVQVVPGMEGGRIALDLAALADRLRSHGEFVLAGGTLKGRIEGLEGETGEPVELTVFNDGRAIITGSSEPEFARSTYARFIGQ